MDELKDLLEGRETNEPPQILALKNYVKNYHGIEVKILSRQNHYLLKVPNASIAQTLQFEVVKISELCRLDKRLVIHIN